MQKILIPIKIVEKRNRSKAYLSYPMKRKLYRATLYFLCLCTIVYVLLTSLYSFDNNGTDENILEGESEIVQQYPVDEDDVIPQDLKVISEDIGIGTRNDDEPRVAKAILKLKNVPNVPYVLNPFPYKKLNSSCAFFPKVYDIQFNNLYWQVFPTENGTVYMYGAYWDERIAIKKPKGTKSNIFPATTPTPANSIRIVAMIDKFMPNISMYCQLWWETREHKRPRIVKVSEIRYAWYASWGSYPNGHLQPYMITCELPEKYADYPPTSVSLVERPCQNATNSVLVVNERLVTKKNFAVCVKGLNFLEKDVSVKLVEWIELLHILGADKIYMYQFSVHPNIQKVLDYYSAKGIIDVQLTSLPGTMPNLPELRQIFLEKPGYINLKRQSEVILYNDCFYRNMQKYRYISLLDTDEVLLPLQHDNWAEMVNAMYEIMDKNNETYPSFLYMRNMYYLDSQIDSYVPDIPHQLHILQHVYRSENYTEMKRFVKGFLDTRDVLTLHNHFPISCMSKSGHCSRKEIDLSLGHLAHYRSGCTHGVTNCEALKNSSVVDHRVWRWKNELIRKSMKVLNLLGLNE